MLLCDVLGCYTEPPITFEKMYTVEWEQHNMDLKCNCRSFEHRRILCKHIFVVMKNKRIECMIPQYLLDRWKDQEWLYVKEAYICEKLTDDTLGRYEDVYRRCSEFAKIRAVSEEKYLKFVDAITEN